MDRFSSVLLMNNMIPRVKTKICIIFDLCKIKKIKFTKKTDE